jgi:hypothetical protein
MSRTAVGALCQPAMELGEDSSPPAESNGKGKVKERCAEFLGDVGLPRSSCCSTLPLPPRHASPKYGVCRQP